MKKQGIGLTGLMFLIFLTLKLTHYIDWSWWAVTAPLWLPTVIVLIVVGFVISVYGCMAFIEKERRAGRL